MLLSSHGKYFCKFATLNRFDCKRNPALRFRRNMMKRGRWQGWGGAHKAISLLRFCWTTISFSCTSTRDVVGPSLAINNPLRAILFTSQHSTESHHRKWIIWREKEWLKALWLYGRVAFPSISQHKTLNGSTINCIIKELLNLLISTKALCDAERNVWRDMRYFFRRLGSNNEWQYYYLIYREKITEASSTYT